MDALDILCAQLMRDLFAIAKFLFCQVSVQRTVRQTKTAVNGQLVPVSHLLDNDAAINTGCKIEQYTLLLCHQLLLKTIDY